MAKKCKHLDQIKFRTTNIDVCAECVKLGDTWVHLRDVHDLRERGLLRFVEEQARHQTFPSHQPSRDAFNRARRRMDSAPASNRMIAGEVAA